MSGVDLVQWLTTQLDTDAATVGAVRPDPSLSPREPIEFILAGQDITLPSTEAAERHIREFADPARVLRDLEMKRQLVKLHGRATLRAGGGAQYYNMTTVCRSCEPSYQFPEQSWPCPTLRLLASVYDERPGYQEAWRP